MFVLGLQGSPRMKGNTRILLDAFLDEALLLGAETKRVDVARKRIFPCLECGTCEKEGHCSIEDDMQEIYPLLWRADLVVMATPVFFYGPTAQLKALIDRSQTLWARRYIHKLTDPGRMWRSGFLLSLGATKGKNLFDGINLTAKYFFDAVGARFDGSLTFRKIETVGDIEKHTAALDQARDEARRLVNPYLHRKKILFLGRKNDCLSQMAGVFARLHGGDRFDVESAGSFPAERIDPTVVQAMEEKGIDMAFKKPQQIKDILGAWKPHVVVSVNCKGGYSAVRDVATQEWMFSDPVERSIESVRFLRDDIEETVKGLLSSPINR